MPIMQRSPREVCVCVYVFVFGCVCARVRARVRKFRQTGGGADTQKSSRGGLLHFCLSSPVVLLFTHARCRVSFFLAICTLGSCACMLCLLRACLFPVCPACARPVSFSRTRALGAFKRGITGEGEIERAHAHAHAHAHARTRTHTHTHTHTHERAYVCIHIHV